MATLGYDRGNGGKKYGQFVESDAILVSSAVAEGADFRTELKKSPWFLLGDHKATLVDALGTRFLSSIHNQDMDAIYRLWDLEGYEDERLLDLNNRYSVPVIRGEGRYDVATYGGSSATPRSLIERSESPEIRQLLIDLPLNTPRRPKAADIVPDVQPGEPDAPK